MKKIIVVSLLAAVYALPAFAQDKKDIKHADTKPERQVFTFVEQMPEAGFDVNEFIAKNITYPEDARKENVEGRVILKFIVSESGALQDIKVARSVFPSVDSEAVRVVKKMPNWRPGKQNGKAVAVSYMLPLAFRLEDAKPADKK
jgi:protein TonB